MRSLEVAKKPIRFVLTAAGAVLIGGLLPAAPASASAGAVAAGYSIQDRGPSIAADLIGLAGVAVGALALARARGRLGSGNGRASAVAAIALGLVGIVVAAVALAIADGGPGTGNGVVGSFLAIVLGLIAAVLGWRALNRVRRIA